MLELGEARDITYFQQQLKYEDLRLVSLLGVELTRVVAQSSPDHERFETAAALNQLRLDLSRAAGIQNVALGFMTRPISNNPPEHYFTFGSRTVSQDIPVSTRLTYNITAATPSHTLAASSVIVDTGTRAVSGTVDTTINQPLGGGAVAVRLALDGTVDLATGTISGAVTNNVGRPAASFCGWLYGPSAAELGFVIAQNAPGPASQRLFGAFVGKR